MRWGQNPWCEAECVLIDQANVSVGAVSLCHVSIRTHTLALSIILYILLGPV